MVLPKQHYCKYIYIDIVFDPGHLFTAASIRRLRPINQTLFDTTRCCYKLRFYDSNRVVDSHMYGMT